MTLKLLMVFLGGGLGSILRFSISELWPSTSISIFPWPTFWANLIASLILGLLLGISLKSGLNKNAQLFLMVGLCGGFSTFSTFSAEVFEMIGQGQLASSLIYVLTSVLICVTAVWVGTTITS